MATSKHAARDRLRLLELRHGLAEIVERGAGVIAERLCVNQSHLERESMSFTESASRYGYSFAKDCLGFVKAPQIMKGRRVVVGRPDGVAIAFASRSILLGAGVGALAVAFVVDITRPCWVRLYNVLRPAPRLTGVPVAACSQAHVFPAAWATRLADYLCRHTDVPKDIATHRLARADGLGVHLVQPLLFQHVGTYSVILHHEKNPANVVSAGFSVE